MTGRDYPSLPNNLPYAANPREHDIYPAGVVANSHRDATAGRHLMILMMTGGRREFSGNARSPDGQAGRRLDVVPAMPGRPPDRTDRGLVMGILSWFRSLRSADIPDEERHSLIKQRYEDPAFEPTEEAAAADVARIEEDDKYFGSDSPANQDEL
jgi:hypothetical protein